MAQTPSVIRDLLARRNHRPRHRFGQNFMVDPNLTRAVADAGEPAPGDQVIEVGPGTGTLTETLLDLGCHVTAFEIDRDLADLLKDRITHENFSLIVSDALAGKRELHPRLHELATGGAKLVANLPYNIASPLVIELLTAGCPLLAFTVQLEVADRLRAGPGTKTYGPLSVVAQSLAEVEVLRTLPPSAFWPPPKITSALVRLRRRPGIDLAAAGRLAAGAATLFQQRRKQLKNAAAGLNLTADDLAALDLDPSTRPETLSVADIRRLTDAAAAKPPAESG